MGDGARRTPARMIADALAKDPFASIFGNKRGSSRGDDEGEVQLTRFSGEFALSLPSGKAGFGQLARPPASVLQRADAMLLDYGGSPEKEGVSGGIMGWLVEVHTPGVPFAVGAGALRGGWDAAWDKYYDTWDKYSDDGLSCIFGDRADGYFVTVTPPSNV